MYEDSRVLELALNLPPRSDIWEYGTDLGQILVDNYLALGQK
jgi:hypothetical protein